MVFDSRGGHGTIVALLSNTQNVDKSGLASPSVPIRAEKLYLGAGWIRSVGGSGYLVYRWMGELEGVQRTVQVARNVSENSWQHYAGVAQPPVGVSQCQVRLLNRAPEGQVYFDNMLFVEIGSPEK